MSKEISDAQGSWESAVAMNTMRLPISMAEGRPIVILVLPLSMVFIISSISTHWAMLPMVIAGIRCTVKCELVLPFFMHLAIQMLLNSLFMEKQGAAFTRILGPCNLFLVLERPR